MAVLTGPPDSIDSSLRLKGFQTFLSEAGIEINPGLIQCGHFQEEKAMALVEPLLKEYPDITAIFCCNDAMAFGVLKKMSQLGIRCPDQISVMGYDGDTRGESQTPPLTTLEVPLYQLAREAVKRLIQFLTEEKKGRFFFYDPILWPVTLVERKSVKAL